MRLSEQQMSDVAKGVLPRIPVTGELPPEFGGGKVPEGLELVCSNNEESIRMVYFNLFWRNEDVNGGHSLAEGGFQIGPDEVPDLELPNVRQIEDWTEKSWGTENHRSWMQVANDCITMALAPSLRATLQMRDGWQGEPNPCLCVVVSLGKSEEDFLFPCRFCETLFGRHVDGEIRTEDNAA